MCVAVRFPAENVTDPDLCVDHSLAFSLISRLCVYILFFVWHLVTVEISISY